MPLAIVIGLVIGFATGGRLRHVAERTFSLGWLLVVGAAVQVVAQTGVADQLGHQAVIGSFAFVAAFTLANLRHPGMGVITVGVLMNLATVAVNGGMPVEDRAIVAAGIVDSVDEIESLDFQAKRHLMTGDDRLYWLSDIIPVPVLGGQVLSFGDLVMSTGVAVVVTNLLHPFPRRRRAKTPRRRAGGTSEAPVAVTPVAEYGETDEDDFVDLAAWESALRLRRPTRTPAPN